MQEKKIAMAKTETITEITCAEAITKSLEALGIKTVFGYTGAVILPVFDALSKTSIKIVVNSNEQSCAFSAAACARTTNNVGVAIVTSGPGITNTLTAVADACADSIPLLVIAGQVPERKLGTDAFQHIDVESIFKRAAKKVITANNGYDMEEIIKDAYFLAKTGKPGPVVIDLPLDKQLKKQSYKGTPISFFMEKYSSVQNISKQDCKIFFDELKKAKKPLLYIGGGLNNEEAAKALKEFNDKMGIPIVNTLMGKGVSDETSNLSLGMLGMFGMPAANLAIQQTDFFFAIGVRWDDRVADKVGSFGAKAQIAYIDINPEKIKEINSERNPFLCIQGDAQKALIKLAQYAEEQQIILNIDEWRKETTQLKKSWPLAYNQSSEFIQQAEAIKELNEQNSDKTTIITGVGNHQMFAAQYITSKTPKTFITSGSFGTMGFALPTSVGTQIANPQKKVIVIDGDGGVKMNLGELNTIATMNLPIKIIVLNNSGDGMVRNLQDFVYNKNRAATTREKSANFAKIAEALGFSYAKRIWEKEKLAETITEFLESNGPAMLEIITDFEEILYPRIPQGKSYSEMNLGPYIKKIE